MTTKASRVKDTIFIVAPPEARRPIEGGCRCPYCLAHPDKTPMWDVYSVDAKAPKWANLVHYPELADSSDI